MTIITPPLIFQYGSPFEPRVSKLTPNGDPTFFVCLLADEAATQHSAWTKMEEVIKETAVEKFGEREYADLCKAGKFRSPIQRDVTSKPAGTVAYLNSKCDADHPPIVVGLDALRIMDRAEIYPGCIVRISVRPFAWGGKTVGFGAGVSLGLQNLQKLSDGPRLASARADGSEFGPVDGGLASLLG
jgi:Enterobacter phage Enc34, ssDNA-binding protein